MSEAYVIMFVCTGNTCRSPMAEGALRMLLARERPGRFEVLSSGTGAATGYPATMYAIEAARIWDVDISSHQSQPLTAALIDRCDLILGLAPRHVDEVLRLKRDVVDRTFLFKNFPRPGSNGEGVDDPIGQPLEVYNKVFLEIGECLGKHLPLIIGRVDEKINAA